VRATRGWLALVSHLLQYRRLDAESAPSCRRSREMRGTRSSARFPPADQVGQAGMFHFLAHEFACLGGGRFAFAFVFTRPFDWFFFRHTNSFRSPGHIWMLRKMGRSPRLSHNSAH